MKAIQRLDRLIVRLVFVRNLLTRNPEVDFDLDLHPSESEVNVLYEAAFTQSEELDRNQS